MSAGIIHRTSAKKPTHWPAGSAFREPLSSTEKKGRFDDVVGRGWTLITSGADPATFLDEP